MMYPEKPREGEPSVRPSQIREDRFRDVVESQCELVCRFLRDGTLTFVNEAYCRFFQRSREELLGERFLVLIPQEDVRRVEEGLASLTPEKPMQTLEHRVLLPSGEIGWQQWNNLALFDPDGTLQEYQSSGRDITELKETQLRLHREKWRLDCILQGTNAGIWEWDPDTGQREVNTRWSELLGYSPGEVSELKPGDWEEMVHPEDLDRVKKALTAHLKDPSRHYMCEYRLRHREGSWLWVQECGMLQAQGHRRLFGVLTDISARREAQECADYNSRLLEVLLSISNSFVNTSPEGVDDNIQRALGLLGEFEGVDRCYVFQFDDGSKTTWSNTHEWCAPGVNPLKPVQQRIPSRVMSWWLQRLTADEAICVGSPADLPPEAVPERAIMEARSLRSVLAVPIRLHGDLLGFLGFDSLHAYRSTPGSVVSLIRMAADILAGVLGRQRADVLLLESQANYTTLFHTLDHLLAVASPDGRILHANASLAQRLGYRQEALLKMRLPDLHPYPLREEARRALNAVLSGERKTSVLPLVSRKGDLIPAETWAWLGRWNGEPCVYSMSRDLSQEQEALQKFDRFFRMIPIPLAVTRYPERTFVEVNEAFLRLYEYTEEEVLGRTSAELGILPDPEDRNRLEQTLEAEGFVREMEVAYRTRSGLRGRGLLSGDLIQSSGRRYFLAVMLHASPGDLMAGTPAPAGTGAP